MAEYKTIGFDPAIAREMPADVAARDLNALIARETGEGWEFIGVQNHSTVVPGDAGCFGFGATPPYPKTLSLVVFRK